MKVKLKKIAKLLGAVQIRTLYRYFGFTKDLFVFKKVYNKSKNKRFSFNLKHLYPCVNDNTTNTSFDRHYVWHTAWAARKLEELNPEIHYDISSSLNFVSIVSAFIPIRFYDYRPANMHLSKLESKHADLTQLPFDDNSISSLSCMHVVEHIGLGRYGDPVDIDGDLKAMEELKRVVKKGGDLLFVVPIGKNIIMYNAHRIYRYSQIVEYFNNFKLIEFSLITDPGQEDAIVNNASEELSDKQEYGCGLFHFKKIK